MDILTENDSFGQYPQSYYAATTNFLSPFSNLKENLTDSLVSKIVPIGKEMKRISDFDSD